MSRIMMVSPLALLLALGACDKPQSTTTTSATQDTKTTPTPTTTTESKQAPGPKGDEKAAPSSAVAGKPVVTFKDVGLSTPESVLYDPNDDTYIVSNIDGKPLEADGKGFLSKLGPDGKVTTLKWIEGGKNKVTLNAPKGLGLVGDTLYVSDLDTVRMFDRKTGAPMGEVKVPGATFLNDVATSGDKVYVSDTGMKAGAGGKFEPTGTDAVYSIDKTKKLVTVAKSKDLGNPNGLFVDEKQAIWVVTFGTGEIYSLDVAGKKSGAQKLPKGMLDGILILPGGDFLVSSWDAQMVYRGKPGGEFKVAVEDVKSPADIGWDSKRSRLMVPLFEANEVRVYDIK
jgi:sugar lactone lactonase YvrE